MLFLTFAMMKQTQLPHIIRRHRWHQQKQNAQLADVLYRAHAGDDLTPVESFQFEMRSNALFRYLENVHYQYRVGLYDVVEFARQREAWGASMRNSRLGQEYWCR